MGLDGGVFVTEREAQLTGGISRLKTGFYVKSQVCTLTLPNTFLALVLSATHPQQA